MQNLPFRRGIIQWFALLAVASVSLLLAGCGGLNKTDAKNLLLNSDSEALQKSIYVDTGFLNARCGQSPTTGEYALLQKAGLIEIHPGSTTEVVTTSKGDELFQTIGAQRMNTHELKLLTGQQTCNVSSWSVPIATRKLIDVTVDATGSDTAEVTYKWIWEPNALGKLFTVNSDVYKSLSLRMQNSVAQDDPSQDLPLDNSLPHATKVRFVRDADGNWKISK